jgi:hypothetical protein
LSFLHKEQQAREIDRAASEMRGAESELVRRQVAPSVLWYGSKFQP